VYSKIKNSLIFHIEQIVVRGPFSRFAIMLFLLGLVALTAGIVIRQLVPDFESIGDAVWWAFEHLVVPEYVDGDEGVVKSTAATILIVLGSIVFAGAVIAILVQWVDETMQRLELGLTPVALGAHFVIAGWTSRTLTIVEEILVSQDRVEHFLQLRGARRLQIALLAENAGARLRQEIRIQLGENWNTRQIILRSGSPLLLDDLERVDFAHAGAILIPAADTTTSNALDADTRTVKTLMTIGAALQQAPSEELPLVVVEIQDKRHIDTLRTLYHGPMEIVSGDDVLSRLMVQTVRHPGLSHVYAKFQTDLGGSAIYVREEPQLIGVSMAQLTHAFSGAVLLGIVRPHQGRFKALLNPPNDLRLEPDDRIAVLAPSYRDAAPPESINAAPELSERTAPTFKAPAQRKVLVLGWNHRVPALLREFASYPAEEFAIDIVSEYPASKRKKRIEVEALSAQQIKIKQMEFDYTVPAYLESVDPSSYDNVVLLASERVKSGAEADARTILGYLLLRDLMATGANTPRVLVELTDPANVTLFDNRSGEVIVSSVIGSYMLARVALRRELDAVYDELFGSAGCEIQFRRIADYGFAEIFSPNSDHGTANARVTFGDLQRAADARGEIAMGVRRAGQALTAQGGVELNPARDEHLQLGEKDDLIVLTTSV
jgi:Trk K+ transport system NAD-binding subunit